MAKTTKSEEYQEPTAKVDRVRVSLLRAVGPDGNPISRKEMQAALEDPVENALPVNTIVYHDMSAIDTHGDEYGFDQNLHNGLAFNSTHRVTRDGEVYSEVVGKGTDPGKEAGWPKAGYKADGNVSLEVWGANGPHQGTSLGMTTRNRLDGPGVYVFDGSVAGVSAPTLTLRIN